MKLIGMLDSPYVRRVAISLAMQDLPFTHAPLSVFSNFDEFAKINPVVKAPTLVTAEGTVLMDSGLILEHAALLAAPGRSLAPDSAEDHARAQRIIGLALAACEKSVQIVYEHNLRPAEKQHAPWLDRVRGQLAAAYRLLEEEAAKADPWLFGDSPLQADITSAVAFRFTREMVPDGLDVPALPGLAALSARAEALEAFQAYPYA
ncbi:glutathione S-transferase family protein [Novosphingobium naphthalenivorans]|uniref:glutathione S-transferase family protein n=1 Tax=Novosphingobium naphthalenivorans TaxID=273168 RepID=UPI00082D4FC5|nr:glutathione S-transferase [Novosphingobium naphthalenivorans]